VGACSCSPAAWGVAAAGGSVVAAVAGSKSRSALLPAACVRLTGQEGDQRGAINGVSPYRNKRSESIERKGSQNAGAHAFLGGPGSKPPCLLLACWHHHHHHPAIVIAPRRRRSSTCCLFQLWPRSIDLIAQPCWRSPFNPSIHHQRTGRQARSSGGGSEARAGAASALSSLSSHPAADIEIKGETRRQHTAAAPAAAAVVVEQPA
jgi:hypothetical protein